MLRLPTICCKTWVAKQMRMRVDVGDEDLEIPIPSEVVVDGYKVVNKECG